MTSPVAGTCKPASEEPGATGKEARPNSGDLESPGVPLEPIESSALGSGEPVHVREQKSAMYGTTTLVALHRMGYGG